MYFKSLFKGLETGEANRSTEGLDSFHVTLTDSTAGDTTEYALHFELSRKVFFSLNRGGLAFSFPDGFDLSLIQVVEFIDDCPKFGYDVRDYEVSQGLLTVFLTKRQHQAPPPSDSTASCPRVGVAVILKVVGNPTKAGRYQLAGLAFNRRHVIVAGPNFSEEFNIIPGVLFAVGVFPDYDISLRAGDLYTFSAVGVDQFGNMIDGLEFHWTLAESSDSIGLFSGSVFQAFRVGYGWAVATSAGVGGRSGRITVVPGNLAKMVLDIFSGQVVGQPLLQKAQITLYDDFDNLKTDYDLNEKRIELVPSTGTLVPHFVDNQDLLSEGVIRLLPAKITYVGPSAVVDILATNGEVTSSAVEVSFNGYDILAVLDAEGGTIGQIFSEVENAVSVVVQNNGSLKPLSPPIVRSYFRSAGGLTQTSFAPNSDGVVDTIPMVLPIVQQNPSGDILVVELTAEYEIAGKTYATTSQRELPVSVVEPYRFELVENSFLPDTVYPGVPFAVSFEMFGEGFGGPIDGTDLVIELAQEPGDGGLLVIYEGSPAFDSFEDGVVRYRGLEAVVSPQAGLQPGWYALKLDYTLISGGVRFGLVDNFPDSIFVLPELQVSYVSNSFEPATVYAGAEAAFRFDVNLGNDFPFAVSLDHARFTVKGSAFSTSTNLILSGDSVYPGENRIETEMLFIPMGQLGESLHVSVSLPLIVPGVGNIVTFETDFEKQKVFVGEQPVAQIIKVDVLAPNAPRVNTGQPFRIRCGLANLSGSILGPLELGLRSDGFSVFDSTFTLLSVEANDTVEVYFDVIASQQPNSGEKFWVEILSTGIGQSLPHDNFTWVIIERPAELEFVYNLFGVEEGLTYQGENFTLTVGLRNSGDAAVSAGTYILTTGGVDFGAEETITGVITVDSQITFPFRAPSFDTTATFVFALVDKPIDSNTNVPAIMEDTSFELSIRVESLEADLFVEPESIGSNLVLPGREKGLFRLNLINRGVSSVTGIRLDEIALTFKHIDNSPLDGSSVIDPVSTGFYEDGVPVSVTMFSGDKVLLMFDNFIVESMQTRSIEFIARFKETCPTSFVLNLEREDIAAAFIEGPNAGQPVEISSSVDGELLISQVYVAKGKTLEESFVIENNPFHPDVSPARFSYELSEPSAVEIRVFTLTGEEVYSRDLPASGTVIGENEIEWHGRNGSGHMVMNGIYVVSIKIVRTGECARIKVAVVK